jgi:hypothetical protein
MVESSEVQDLINDPESYYDISAEYSSDQDCYETLLKQAKQSLATFEEYIEFHSVLLDHGPTEYVQHQLKRNTLRSLKNMILQTSTAGKRFPIHTLEQLQKRIKKYKELGVESVNQRAVAFTLLEHLFDDDSDDAYIYTILDRILNVQPSQGGDLVAILVRARFVIAAQTVNRQTSLDTYAEELFDDLPDPKAQDKATAREQFEASKRLAYDNPEKLDYAASAVAKDGDAEILEEYLYLSARDAVERYRHKSRNNPWRGELQLALRQWNCILNAFSETHSDERLTRSQSYRHIVSGVLKSGGRWQSQRDSRNLPETKFLSAAGEYYKAAEKIKDVSPVRYIKYLSKSFRFQATGAQNKEWGPHGGWLATRLLHEQAVKITASTINEFEETDRLRETLTETAIFHNFRRHKAAAFVAFEQRNIEELSDEIDEARSHLDANPFSADESTLNTLEDLNEGLIFEDTHEFEEAIKKYEEATSQKINIETRIQLVNIKKAIKKKQYEEAQRIAEESFGENSPIHTAVSLSAGDTSNKPAIKPPNMEGMSAVNREKKWMLVYMVHLFSSGETIEDNDSIEQLIYDL